MKLTEFKKLIREEVKKVLKEGDDLRLLDDLDVLIPTIKRAFKTKYPDPLYFQNDANYLYVSTDKRNPDAASMWGRGNPKHYYLAINLYADDAELVLVVANATANNFKGVTTPILKAIFDYGMKALKPVKKKVLSIEDDKSGGVWKKIALQLGVTYEADGEPVGTDDDKDTRYDWIMTVKSKSDDKSKQKIIQILKNAGIKSSIKITPSDPRVQASTKTTDLVNIGVGEKYLEMAKKALHQAGYRRPAGYKKLI